MAVTVTIAGVAYTIIENNGQPVPGYVSGSGSANTTSSNVGIAGGSDSGYQQTSNLQERQRWQCDVMDYSGTAAAQFQKGDQVIVTDPVLGVLFRGFINTDKMQTIYPSGIVRHSIDCTGLEDIPGRRTYTRTYSTSSEAGKIAVDMLNDVLLDEGIAQNFAEHEDSTAAEFSQGILSNTVGIVDPNGNNWLQLGQSGSNVTIVENTTALFATGTLTNTQASNNELLPTTESGLKVEATLPFGQNGAFLKVNFWSGSQALGTNDTLNFSILISSTSPSITCSVGLTFTDGSFTTGILDNENGFAIDPSTDLSSQAKDYWYQRSFPLSTYNGKTVQYVYVAFGGTSTGTYTCYVHTVFLSSISGSPFFSSTATTTQLNPMVVASYQGYAPSSVIASVIPVDGVSYGTVSPGTLRISPAYSIDAVKLLGSSIVNWTAATPAGSSFTLYASYDGGTTYHQCTNNAALPALPAGSNVAGLTITLKEFFAVGSDPSQLPALSQLSIALISAPPATKSDVVATYANTAQWNTGTFTGTQVVTGITAAGNLATGNIVNGWNVSQIINQTFIFSGATQAVSDGKYNITVTVGSTSNVGLGRLDWAGTITEPFTLDTDISIPSTYNNSSVGYIQYLQTYWYTGGAGIAAGKGAYTLALQQSGVTNNIVLYRGTNSSTNTSTTLAQTTANPPSSHVKFTVSASGVHNIYFDGSSTPILTVTDTTYTSGQIAIGGFITGQTSGTGGTGVFTYSNTAITPLPTETWLSPAVSISSLGTCGGSIISWTEYHTQTADKENAAIFIQSTIDGGSTYQTCTNGQPIPGLTSGVNVSGKSVRLLVNFYVSPSNFYLPQLSQLVYRVLGQYPGSSGTRSTVPLGNDMSITRTVGSGWGNAFDGQAYTQIGTGTTAVASGEETITNTTGDVHMVLGSRTWTDEDGTVRFQLSAATIVAGIELRYTDANNFYRLQASTTAVSIIKVQSGVSVTLASVSMTINTGTYYRMRFRVTGASQPLLQGNVWPNGQIENTINPVTGQWDNTRWTIQAVD